MAKSLNKVKTMPNSTPRPVPTLAEIDETIDLAMRIQSQTINSDEQDASYWIRLQILERMEARIQRMLDAYRAATEAAEAKKSSKDAHHASFSNN